jgi:glycosyltransferase involved in cell wall biosynthesis
MSHQPNKIKLFIDAHTFDKEFQGTRTFIRELYREVAKIDDRFEFYIGAADVEHLKREFDFLPNAHFIQYKFESSLLRLTVEIPFILKKYRIDVSHYQYIVPFWGRGKFIVTTHDILFNDFKSEFSLMYRVSRNFLFRRSIKRAHYKTTVSNYSRDRISFHYHIHPNSISVIPNGVNAMFFEPYDKVETKLTLKKRFEIERFILYVSRVEPRKNNILALKAYLNLKLYTKSISLVFVGKKSIDSPEFFSALAQLTDEQKPFVKYFEQLSEEDLMLFYRSTILFVYPSKAEGFGIPPLEAAAIGVPVVCSNRTAMADFDFFGKLLFDPYDQSNFEEKISSVIENLDEAFTDEIKQTVKNRYSWVSSAKAFLALFTN